MKALIVDGDRVIADIIAFSLWREGFQVVQAHNGLSALRCWLEEKPDLIILDVNLPDLDGFSICQRLRKETDIPIILLTARNGEDDIVHGLELGADVYMTKPFSPRQLVARARAILRRTSSSKPAFPCQDNQPYRLNQWHDPARPPKSLLLTPLEKRLLDLLRMNSERVLSPEEIIAQIWGHTEGDRDRLRQLIRRLRIKIEPDPSHPVYLKTIPGIGYRLVGASEAH